MPFGVFFSRTIQLCDELILTFLLCVRVGSVFNIMRMCVTLHSTVCPQCALLSGFFRVFFLVGFLCLWVRPSYRSSFGSETRLLSRWQRYYPSQEPDLITMQRIQWLKCNRTQGNAVPQLTENGLLRSSTSDILWTQGNCKRNAVETGIQL